MLKKTYIPKLFAFILINVVVTAFAFTFSISNAVAQDTIVYWNFPVSAGSLTAQGGITANLTKAISREAGFGGSYTYSTGVGGTGDYTVSTTTWNAGMGVKYWETEFSTDQYDTIVITSKQRASSTGPRDFKVEYSLDNVNWFDVPGAVITVGDNWTTGVLAPLKLPVACWNQTSVRLRWIMTSDVSVGGGTVASAGTSRFDDIYITGVAKAGPDIIPPVVLSAYPLSDSVVTVLFSEAVDIASATNLLNYSFNSGAGILSITSPAADSVIINLFPKLVLGQPDTLTISDVADLSANTMATPQKFEILYAPTIDVIAPFVVSVKATSLTTIEILFSEPLNILSATDTANYLLLKGNVSDSVANINISNDVVTLTLFMPGLPSGVVDTLMISDVEDPAGNPMLNPQKFPVIFAVEEVIVFWNFPNNPDDQIADGGIVDNLGALISREPSFSGSYNITTAGVTNQAISTTGWNDGDGLKYWQISFTSAIFSAVYDSLKLSSKQRSSDTGPRDFKVQYSLDNMSWTDIPGGDIVVANNWTSGVLNKLEIPKACWGQPQVSIRWIMTSNTSTNASTVASAGTSRIDDIYVKGKLFTGVYVDINQVQIIPEVDVVVYPNPARDVINIASKSDKLVDVDLFDIRGLNMTSMKNVNPNLSVDVSSYPAGIYILSITDYQSQQRVVRKVIVK